MVFVSKRYYELRICSLILMNGESRVCDKAPEKPPIRNLIKYSLEKEVFYTIFSYKLDRKDFFVIKINYVRKNI